MNGICDNGLCDRLVAQQLGALHWPEKGLWYYPTGWTGRYVVVNLDNEAALSATLTPAHPLWYNLVPATPDPVTMMKHLRAMAAEMAALDSAVTR